MERKEDRKRNSTCRGELIELSSISPFKGKLSPELLNVNPSLIVIKFEVNSGPSLRWKVGGSMALGTVAHGSETSSRERGKVIVPKISVAFFPLLFLQDKPENETE